MKKEFNCNEKVSVNFSAMELGQIDALVEQGFYSDRSDLIRTAVRAELDKRSNDLEIILKAKSPYEILSSDNDGLIVMTGILRLGRKELEAYKAGGIKLVIKMIGAFIIEKDVSADLVKETIQSAKVWGKINATDEIKKILQ
ncbi:hypothetical protein [Faecalicatena contorta]|uniref:CopG family transcriptional regulator n=1 Tax=Faecalicatena contorta TaxID=39482 RepID=A0A315ZYI2_9FIRM|nr:hypothetical protein [Faecalicatena contorta]PWJ50373.1 hypothetical protein A8805_10492 [Faecalicatena contorta]SUQ13781.1 hypothetical protein SAMN05216529_10492 [Faecalicatena contorta]